MSDTDNAVGNDSASVGVLTDTHDSGKWHCHTTLKKFHGDSTDEQDCYETLEIDGNLLVTGGVSALLSRLIGSTAVGVFSNANAHIGVGNSTTAEATAQTDLVGGSKFRAPMDPSYPMHTDSTTLVSAKTFTFRATFETDEANFVWAEWGVFNADTAGRMLNRKVQALGTKVAGATWQLTVAITIN